MSAKKKKGKKFSCNYCQFRLLLRNCGVSQVGLARALGVERATVNKWATGKVAIPGYAIFAVLALREVPINWRAAVVARGCEVSFSPYATLGLNEGSATRRNIKLARARLARIYHPDLGGSNELMKEINDAVEKLLAKIEG